MVVALCGLDEADRALLDEVEHAVELRKWRRLLEDERLIRFDEPLARLFVAAFLERGPELCFLRAVECLDLAQFLHVLTELHAAHLLSLRRSLLRGLLSEMDAGFEAHNELLSFLLQRQSEAVVHVVLQAEAVRIVATDLLRVLEHDLV